MFDFNKMRIYKETMEYLGVYKMEFDSGYGLLLFLETNWFELWKDGECVLSSDKDFEKFVIDVTNYFLNGGE